MEFRTLVQALSKASTSNQIYSMIDEPKHQSESAMALSKQLLLYAWEQERDEQYPDNFSFIVRLYEASIRLGTLQGIPYLAQLYHDAPKPYQDLLKAAQWYDQGIEQDLVVAMINRASMYAKGEGGPQDIHRAIALYDAAVIKEHPSAMTTRGFMYQKGIGSATNTERAIDLYQRAAAMGDANAMYNLATIYYYGYDVRVDYAKAIRWYSSAIDLNHPKSLTQRGLMHLRGHGEPNNLEAAIDCFERAIEGNDSQAMVCRARLYRKRLQDEGALDKSIILYERAITLQNPTAMYARALDLIGSNNGRAIALLEGANRMGLQPAARRLDGIPLDNETANHLLDYIWDDLLAAKQFSTKTLNALARHATRTIANKLLSWDEMTRLDLKLLELVLKPQHPIGGIFRKTQSSHTRNHARSRVLRHIATLKADAKLRAEFPVLFFNTHKALEPNIQNLIGDYLSGGDIDPLDASEVDSRGNWGCAIA